MNARKLLATSSFLDDVYKIDPTAMSPTVLRALKKHFVGNPDFTPHVVARYSVLCQALCAWVIAMCECGCDIHGIA